MKKSINLSLDGDRWCARVGEDLQIGEAGFGSDPIAALINLRSKLPSETIEVAPQLLAAIPEDIEQVRDGYHSFLELYEHRHLLFAAFIDALIEPVDQRDIPRAWKSRRHHDGSNYPGWFIVGIELPIGQISYHLPDRLWSLFSVVQYDRAPQWDGHTSDDVLKRLRSWIVGNQFDPRDKDEPDSDWSDRVEHGTYDPTIDEVYPQ